MINKKRGLLILCMILLLGGLVSAIPQTFSVHGKLENNAGSPLEGTYNMSFNIYNAYTGGSSIWNLSNQNVDTDSNGIYNVVLTSVNLDFGSQYYLGVTVGNDSEMSPRINLSSSPYAFEAQNVSVSGVRFNSNVDFGTNYNFTFDGGTLFVDGSKGYVGIGTITPNATLHIVKPGVSGDNVTIIHSGGGANDLMLIGNSGYPYAVFSEANTNDPGNLQLKYVGVTTISLLANGNTYFNNGNVGIGTTTPQQKLHVNGSILANGTINATTDVCIQGGACLSSAGTGSGTISGSGTSNYVPLWNGTSSINKSNIYQGASGNIGIGTVNPISRLEINSAANGGPAGLNINFATRTNTEDSTSAINVTGTLAKGTVFKVEAGGNVGIGTSSPQQKLDVVGNINSTGFINATTDVCIQGGACLSSVSASAGGWTKTGTQVALTTATDNVSIGSTDFFVDNSKGYVGIGTTSPKSLLTVSNYDISQDYTRSTSVGTFTWIELCNVTDVSNVKIIARINSQNNEEVAEILVQSTYYVSDSLIEVTRQTYNSRFMEVRVGAAGYGSLRTIYVKLRTDAYAPTITWSIMGKGISSISNTDIGSSDPSLAYYATLPLSINALKASTSGMTIGGYVGIGTTSPGAVLDINGANDVTQFRIREDDASPTVATVNITRSDNLATNNYNNSLLYLRDHSYNVPLYITDNNFNPLFIVNGSGYVGIGTTAPATPLDIDTGSNSLGLRLRGLAETTEIGDIHMNSAGALVISTTAGTGSASFIDLRPEDNDYGLILRESDGTGTASYANFYVTDDTDDLLSINVNSIKDGDALVVTASNNVGIGTTSPQQKLHVNGNILANGTINATTDLCIQGGACLSSVSASAGGWTKTGTQVALTTATDNVSIGSTDFFVDNSKGYVGIGTTAPKKELDIVGNIKVSGYVYSNGCPNDMAYVSSAGGFCIDKWEASRPDATDSSMGSDTSMAISQAGVIPWVSISQIDSRTACNNAGKRLCSDEEWLAAANIQGQVYYLPTNLAVSPYYCVTDSSTYCLGHSYSAGDACNTGNKTGCVSKEGVYDMVGNVWEWTNETVDVIDSGSAEWKYANSSNGWQSSTSGLWNKYGNDGVYFPVTTPGRAVLRGGAWDRGALAGPFCASLGIAPTAAGNSFGFRCCSG